MYKTIWRCGVSQCRFCHHFWPQTLKTWYISFEPEASWRGSVNSSLNFIRFSSSFFFWHTRHIFTSLGGPERLNTKLKFVKVNENSPPSKPGSGTAVRRWWPPLHSINVLTVVFIDKIKHSYLVYIPCLFGYSFWLHIFVVLFRSYNYRVSQKSPIHRGN